MLSLSLSLEFRTFAFHMEIDVLTIEQVDCLQGLINEGEHIVICAHRSPDGDAIGSSLGMAGYLRSQGKNPFVCVPDMFPDFLQWMPGAQGIVRFDKHPEEVTKAIMEADIIFCLDFSQEDRLGDMTPLLVQSKAKKVVIDHHPSPTIPSVLRISQPQMSSASEVVFRVIWQLGGFELMTRQDAVCLYCGMMTDTGGFTYNSAAPELFFIISQLLTKGINKDKIYRNVYHTFSEWRLRLTGYVLYQKMNVFPHKHAAYFTLTRQDLKRFHYVKGDAEGLVNMPLQMRGIRLSISLREDTEHDNLIWVSLRSVDDFSCTKMAEKYFNGGGHLNASGGRLYCTMAEAEQIVRKAIEEL